MIHCIFLEAREVLSHAFHLFALNVCGKMLSNDCHSSTQNITAIDCQGKRENYIQKLGFCQNYDVLHFSKSPFKNIFSMA